MTPVQEFRKILKGRADKYTDEEIEKIIEKQDQIADIFFDILVQKVN